MSTISRTFNGGDSCTISATPSAHYHFVNWTENGSEITKLNPYTFTVDSDRTITGNFAIDSHYIGTSVSPSGGGSITGTGSYNYGDTCTLTATANTGYHFVNWTTEGGDFVSNDNPYSFTVSGDASFQALYAINSYNITTSVDPSGSGSVSGGGSYNHGSTVSLTATANTGYAFVGWYEDSSRVNTSNPLTFTATQDRSIVAKFTPTYTIQVSYDNAQGSVSFVEFSEESE